jgi:hypothetical protein
MTIVLASDADPVRSRPQRRGVDALVVDGGAAGNPHVATFAAGLAIRLLPVQTFQWKPLDGGDRGQPRRAKSRGQA